MFCQAHAHWIVNWCVQSDFMRRVHTSRFVPTRYIDDLVVITTAVDPGTADAVVNVTALISVSGGAPTTAGCSIDVSLFAGDVLVANATGAAGMPVAVAVSNAKLWSPASPTLHNATVSLRCNAVVVDTVHTYVGIRTIALTRLRSVASPGCQYGAGSTVPGYPKPMATADDCERACIAPACAAWSHGTAGTAPPTPASPGAPKVGFDFHGNDLPGMPIALDIPFSPNASAAKCEELCDQESQCEAWSIDIPGCVFPGHETMNKSDCWLKSTAGHLIRQTCRICGTRKQLPAPPAAAPPTAICTLHSMVPAVTTMPQANGASCGHWATKIMLNGKVAPFLAGILSQGFWPDGE